MSRGRSALFIAIAAVSLALLPSAARAQSSFAGVVKDSSGGVVPGVTVTASSDVLIEKERAVVTDAEGLYKIIDLRPGVYNLTFTLEGFSTVKREGLELPSNFVMSVNGEMRMGSLEETLTVTGESPVVDVQSNTKATALSRELIESVPTAHTLQGMGQLIVGVQLTAPDVAGSQAGQQTYFAVHGTGREQAIVFVDGMMVNGMMYDGGVNPYMNDGMVEEMVYQTGGGAGDSPTGGLKMNLIPKDGGNRFSGTAFASGINKSMQQSNLTDFLLSKGVKSVDSTAMQYDMNGGWGGPLKKDKLWFYNATRAFRTDKPVQNTFYADGRQGLSDETLENLSLRLTWQASQNNKFSAYFDRVWRHRGHAMSQGDDPATASVVWDIPVFATGAVKWTSTVSSKMLVEAGYSINRMRYKNGYQPGIAQPYGTPAWYAGASIVDNGLSTRTKASAAEYQNLPDKSNATASLSYVTGSHNFKVGFQNSWGVYPMGSQANADLYQNYTNGAVVSVTALSTPVNWQENLNASFGLYAQDSWTINRFTIGVGARYDYQNQEVGAMPAQGGRFASFPAHDAIQMPIFKSFSPRTSIVWNVFGNGKTAVRAGFNRFETASTTGIAEMYDPTTRASATLSWTDLNKDNIAQGERGCVYQTPGCEINMAQLPKNFGIASLNTPDPGLDRPYQLAYNMGVQHELRPGMSVTFEWFHTDFKNLMVRNNVLRNADSYTAVNVVSPMDGSTITVYNVKSAFVQAVQNADSTDSKLKQWYNGFEFNFNARLPHGVKLFGGTSTERNMADSCDSAATNPNNLLYCDQTQYGTKWRTQFKLVGTLPLKWGVNLSGSLQALPGYLLGSQALAGGFQASSGGLDLPNGRGSYWQITPTTRYAATCTGSCTPGALVIPGLTTSTLLVPLAPTGTEMTPRITELDFAIGKSFTFGRLRMNPKLDIFNIINSDDYYAVSSTLYTAATYLQPSRVLQGRVLRLGVDVKW